LRSARWSTNVEIVPTPYVAGDIIGSENDYLGMRTGLFCCILTVTFYSCSHKTVSSIQSKQPALSQNDYILVLQEKDDFVNDGIEIGTISAGDNRFSVNCSYNEIMANLDEQARKNGANIIKIVKQKSSNRWRTCERIKAKIYKVPNFRTHEHEIKWTATRRLTWEDFKGKPKVISNTKKATSNKKRVISNTNTTVQTYCDFGFESNRIGVFKTQQFFVKNTFDCDLSWVRQDQIKRDDLLKHEQTRFDLSEVYARRLRQLLTKKNSGRNFAATANAMFKKVYVAYLDRQELYETETKYGLDRVQQNRWTKQVAAELVELSSWAR
jgi:hypothetical protein